MRVIKFVQYFLFTTLLYPVFGAGAAAVKIPLHEVAPVGITNLKCSEAEFNIKLPIPERWRIKSGFIDFSYVNSSALLPQNSRLVLKLNGYPLAQIELNPLAPEGKARVRLPGELLDSGYNDLTFYVSQHYTMDCEVPCAPELWTTLSLDKAFIELEYDMKPVPLKLSSIPGFLFDPKILPYGKINIVTEDGSQESISLASIVASGIALRFDYRQVDFNFSKNIMPGVDNIVIGRKEFVESILGDSDISIDGPYLQIAHVLASQDAPTGRTLDNPAPNGTAALIIVSGNNFEEMKLAATSLAVLSFPFPDADRVDITQVILPEVTPYSGKSILDPGETYAFSDMGFSSATFTGFTPEPKNLPVRLPADLLLEQNQYADLYLHLAYGAGMRSDSVLNIRLNNQLAAAIPLNNPNGAVFSDYKISIPIYLFNNGDNAIRFEPVLTPSVSGRCELIRVENLFLTIFGDSTFRFPSLSHWIGLPKIELFFQDGFPFTRWPDGRETALYVASADDDTVGSALNLIGIMTQKIGYPQLRLNVVIDNPRDWKGEIIAVGDIGNMPEDIKDRAPLKYGSMVTAPYPLVKSMSLDGSVPAWKRIRNYISGNSEQKLALADETVYMEQTGGLGEGQGSVMEFQSPYQSGRSLLLVTAATPNDLLALSRALGKTSVQGGANGDLVLVDFKDGEYNVMSQTLGNSYYAGNQKSGDKLKSLFNSSRSAYFVLLVLAFVALTFSIYYVLRRNRSGRVGS